MDSSSSSNDFGDEGEAETRALKIICPDEICYEVCGPLGEVEEDIEEADEGEEEE